MFKVVAFKTKEVIKVAETKSVSVRASPGKNHCRMPNTQHWMRWIRTVASKKPFSPKELLAEMQRFVPNDPDPRAPEILFWLTKGILAGPKNNYYVIPSRKGTVKAYFFQHPDPFHPRHQPIAPKAKNLTASGLWQGPEKAVPLEIIIKTQEQESQRQGSISIVKGQLETKYPLTFETILEFLPKKIS